MRRVHATLTVLATVAVLAGNLLADLLYGLFDPRVKLSGLRLDSTLDLLSRGKISLFAIDEA
ncbi:hypothetical protein ABZ710_19305, partial [Streptomyces anthocyanicus]